MKFKLFCLVLIAVGTTTIVLASGCHRGFYRRQADAEAQALIRQKACDPRWNLQDTTINIDPESRMFDPFSADHPPIPPDDPTSHQLMKCVDGKNGYPHWHANGDTSHVENPEWLQNLPINDKGIVELDLERAFRLAQIHSTDYQQQREELYLSALDVSLDRFGFDSQLFSGFNSFVENRGALSAGGPSTTLETALGNQGLRLQKLGITGSTLATGLANTMIWQFAGPNTQTATTLLDFSLIQPLLRGAGRDRILETLTQSERTLLANVRQMERYRRGFYLQVVIGRNPGQGPSRAGNFLIQPGTGSANAGGFLGLLQTQQQIRIQEYNVSSLKNVLDQLQEFLAAERIDSLQVAQAQSQLYGAQNNLLRLKTNYQRQLDAFKQSLGLPPDLPVSIRDPILDQFELIDDGNNKRQEEIDGLKIQLGEKLIAITEKVKANRFRVDEKESSLDYGLRWNQSLAKDIADLKPFLQKIKPLVTKIRDDDAIRVKQDFDKFESVRGDRIADLKSLREFIRKTGGKERYSIDPSLLSDAGLDVPYDPNSESFESNVAVLERVPELRDQLKTLLTKNLVKIEQELKRLNSEIDKLKDVKAADVAAPDAAKRLYKQVKDGLLDIIPQQLTEIGSVALELSLLQARARADSIELPQIEIDAIQATKIAREFRRDWMNARASLVDQWRQIEFVADQLESQLDIVVSGSVGNFGSNPFSLRAETGTVRAGFQFDSPINRQQERNTYRETLIRYQQSKRSFYEFEDAIKANLREIIRQIQLNRIQFELNRRSVKVSIRQVENARLRLEEPASVNSIGRINQLGATTTRDLTGAINQLQGDQNAFLNVWVSLEVLRRNLDFDMGTMQLDDSGAWIDPGEIDPSIAQRVALKYGIDCDPLSGELILVPEGVQPNIQNTPAPETPTPADPSNGSNPTDGSNRLDQGLLQIGKSNQPKSEEPVSDYRRLMSRLTRLKNRSLQSSEPVRSGTNSERTAVLDLSGSQKAIRRR